MKVERTGNTKAKFKRMTWIDMVPCNQCKSFICNGAIGGHRRRMNYQNTCIDLIEAKSSVEILEIWFEKVKNLEFSPITFFPNSEYYHYRKSKNYIQEYKWESESKVVLEIVPENVDGILTMNQGLYDRLRGIAYDEDDELKFVENTLKIWVKNLKNDILYRFLKSEVTKKEYQELEGESIWEMVDQQKKVSQISFRSMVDEELARIKRGISLVPDQKLIQDEYKMPDYAGHDKFDVNYFIHRIIANDIARIIHDLKYNSFFPDCSPPYFIKTLKHGKYLELQDELNPKYINKLGFWTGDKIDCARLIATLENLGYFKFKSSVPQLEVTKYFGLRFYDDEYALMEQLKK